MKCEYFHLLPCNPTKIISVTGKQDMNEHLLVIFQSQFEICSLWVFLLTVFIVTEAIRHCVIIHAVFSCDFFRYVSLLSEEVTKIKRPTWTKDFKHEPAVHVHRPMRVLMAGYLYFNTFQYLVHQYLIQYLVQCSKVSQGKLV